MKSTTFGEHSLWVLDFDLCRRMKIDSEGVVQAADAFWRNVPFYTRPNKDPELWSVFREHYLQVSQACKIEPDEADERRILSRHFIELVEQKGKMMNEPLRHSRSEEISHRRFIDCLIAVAS